MLEQHEGLGLTPELLEKWVALNNKDPEIKAMADNIDNLHKQVFEDELLEHINFVEELPEKMTSQMYIRIYRKIWATVRHDLWGLIKEKKKETNCISGELPARDFQECYNAAHKNFEKIRQTIYELMMEEQVMDEATPRRIMQRAYCSYATKGVIQTDEKGNRKMLRSRWADQVNAAASQHSKYI